MREASNLHQNNNTATKTTCMKGEYLPDIGSFAEKLQSLQNGASTKVLVISLARDKTTIK